ncbi:MAG: hypothetical protein KJO21_08915 [Verrucomicrobiae bacterium]|nr:hypothetical protein [Verrucomicrobiae bacterium]NNJ42294.1 hypothetical protein [Akkermansiaceae bacterium]
MSLSYFQLPSEGTSSTDIQASGIWNTGAALDKLLKHIETYHTSQGQLPKHACDQLRANRPYDFTLRSGNTHTGKIVSDDNGWLVIKNANLSPCILATHEIESITPAKTEPTDDN